MVQPGQRLLPSELLPRDGAGHALRLPAMGPGTSAGPDLGAASLARYLFEECHAIGRRRTKTWEDMGRGMIIYF